jgi:hypothetical protein
MNQHVPQPRQQPQWPNWWGLVSGLAPSAAAWSFDSPVIEYEWNVFGNNRVYSYVVAPQQASVGY